ncbi:hypothetical protein QBC40DRAFT_325872 [Triangularia verruculosa]|uniref:DUF676 domain-containing protein n=1 Tax=Triangularia verruculosa TaxID=2587418 RepID=A0AAN6XRB0_9PEZI|nr:hypothetical protein QBC40DRAFT_325872 [Triangularia verruculosa]
MSSTPKPDEQLPKKEEEENKTGQSETTNPPQTSTADGSGPADKPAEAGHAETDKPPGDKPVDDEDYDEENPNEEDAGVLGEDYQDDEDQEGEEPYDDEEEVGEEEHDDEEQDDDEDAPSEDEDEEEEEEEEVVPPPQPQRQKSNPAKKGKAASVADDRSSTPSSSQPPTPKDDEKPQPKWMRDQKKKKQRQDESDAGNRQIDRPRRRKNEPSYREQQQALYRQQQQQQQMMMQQQQQQGGGGGGGKNPLRLRLDLNLEIEIELKAHIHGDLTLALLLFYIVILVLITEPQFNQAVGSSAKQSNNRIARSAPPAPSRHMRQENEGCRRVRVRASNSIKQPPPPPYLLWLLLPPVASNCGRSAPTGGIPTTTPTFHGPGQPVNSILTRHYSIPPESTMSIRPTGFTILHEPPNPSLDIIFVHGLQGHPEKTWTSGGKRAQSRRSEGLNKWGSSLVSCFAPPRDREKETDDGEARQQTPVFWPRDLLREDVDCSKARIMTYGYDSFVLKIVKGRLVNDITISQHGQSLLQEVARERWGDRARPLMFVAHSLGGLLVKAALNNAYLERENRQARDLHSVLDSTFAIIFLGTPHRGSANYADFGTQVARVAALVTMNGYNDRIISNLTPNNEILTNLRRNFEITYEYLVQKHGFESSTFQEGQGLTDVPRFRGKVVDGDSSELGHRHDRQHVLNRNHRDMCKFTSAEDPEYIKVQGEISRHIRRHRELLQEPTDEESNAFMASLQNFAQFATLRKGGIAVRHAGTAEWIWTATALSEAEDGSRPGSGKSTTMKFLLDDETTKEYLSTGERSEGSDGSTSEWYSIGLFITSRGTEQQRQWQPMLQGILYQLLCAQPELLPGVMAMAKRSQRHVQHPIRVLILFDGLDELQDPKDAAQAVSFLKSLATRESPSSTTTTFKVCFASRSENQFMNLFTGVRRVHVHEHTRQDIRRYTWDRLSQNPRFMHENKIKTQKQLGAMIDLICKNAHGVFLWVYSIVSIIDQSLADGETISDLYETLAGLPTEMDELYRHMLHRIDPRLRKKAYLMLETVLRSRKPLTLQELFLIVKVAESNLSGKPSPWSSRTMSCTDDFLDPARMQSQLLASCRCFLEIVRPEGRLLHGRYQKRDGTRAVDPATATVQLLHRTAKDFLLFKGEEVLGEALDGKEAETEGFKLIKPKGNGHVYVLQFVRAWWMLDRSARGRLLLREWDGSKEVQEIMYHAPLVEETLLDDAKHYFPLLDDLDRQATVLRRDSYWPPVNFASRSKTPWKLTFAAFAVEQGMVQYVGHLIAKAAFANGGGVPAFLNRDDGGGRPLLHIALDSSSKNRHPPQLLAMLELLLKKGASVTQEVGGKTAIEKLRFERMDQGVYKIYKLFLEYGANPNSYWYPAGDLHFRCPLIHLVAYSNSNEEEQLHEDVVSQRAIDLMRLLVEKGADVKKEDSEGKTLVTAFCRNKRVLPLGEWWWLLRNGGMITVEVVRGWKARRVLGSQDLEHGTAAEVLCHQRFRRREWYEDDAAKEAECRWPGWFGEAVSDERDASSLRFKVKEALGGWELGTP